MARSCSLGPAAALVPAFLGLAAFLLQGCTKPLPIIPPGFTNTTCAKDTTGTCHIGSCSSHRGPTDCLGGKCLCKFGYCAVNGECVSSCERETTGTCKLLACKDNHGPTDCVGGKCLCKPGYCADHQKYACALPCDPDTYGSCRFFSCSKSRGPTDCVHKKCMCKPGYCAQHGICVATPVIHTTFAEEEQAGRKAGVPPEPRAASAPAPPVPAVQLAVAAALLGMVTTAAVAALVVRARGAKAKAEGRQALLSAESST